VIVSNVPIEGVRAETMTLSATEIETNLNTLPGWTTDGKEISRTFKFKDFVSAIAFVNKLVEPAESAGHHPDIVISYNKVIINLTTHDAGGITQKDFDLATVISNLAQ
jgi:4a-hydroxytetrahydrobiopterin dehydratase